MSTYVGIIAKVGLRQYEQRDLIEFPSYTEAKKYADKYNRAAAKANEYDIVPVYALINPSKE